MADALPVEVVAHILGFLRVSDRKEASLVNHVWYEASMDPALQRGTTFTIHANHQSSKWLKILLKRRSLHLILDNIDGSKIPAILDSKEDVANNLFSLSLKGSDVTERVFVQLLQNCNSLQSLDVSCCNALFMTGMLLHKETDLEKVKAALKHVAELNLSTIRYISDVTFNRLLSVCPNTQRLHLAGNQIIFHSDGVYKGTRVKPTGNTAVLTFANVLLQVEKIAKNLKMLDFSRTALYDEALWELGNVKSLTLQELRLVCCREMSFSEFFSSFCERQKELETLDISHCEDFTDSDLSSICQHLVKLKYLNLGHCRRLTDISVSKLRFLQALRRLDLASCYVVTSMGLALGLCKSVNENLTELNLSCCSSVRDGFVAEACVSLPHLSKISLSSCSITDKSIHYIAKYLVHLQVLELSWCKNISDNGLLGIVDEKDPRLVQEESEGMCKCTRKRHVPAILDLRRAASNEERGEAGKDEACSSKLHLGQHKKGDWVPLSNLRSLQVLDLSSCHRITDVSIQRVMTFPELKSLYLSMCPSITDDSLHAISCNMPSLERLHVAQSPKLTDAGIRACVQQLWRLQDLNIANCDGLTNASLDAIAEHGKRLQNLDVSLCGHLSSEAVERLEEKMKQLRSLQKRLIVGSPYDFI